MSETLTFAEYGIKQHGLPAIYSIGTDEHHKSGVIPEIAAVYGHELTEIPEVENLSELVREVARNKELQKNIPRAQEVLGIDNNALGIAQGWVERSGLLIPANRSFATPIIEESDHTTHVVMSGGVRNWMTRRELVLVDYCRNRHLNNVLLFGGNKTMSASEGFDVKDGITESDYMRDTVLDYLLDMRIPARLIQVDSGSGDEIKKVGLKQAEQEELIDLSQDHLAVVSNAGVWIQDAGQFRRAAQSLDHPYFDIGGKQVFVITDGIKLGTGDSQNEPSLEYQNPFSAIGLIVRNALELARHYKEQEK